MKLILIKENVSNTNPKNHPNNFDPHHQIDLYYDDETGVEYFVMNVGNSSSIYPRLSITGHPTLHKRNI